MGRGREPLRPPDANPVRSAPCARGEGAGGHPIDVRSYWFAVMVGDVRPPSEAQVMPSSPSRLM
jgi:hypothetical protein